MIPAPPGQPQDSLADAAARNRAGWVLLAALGVWAAAAVPWWCGRILAHDDAGAFHLPLRWFYARQLAAGEPFDWFEGMFAGFYLTGEGQVGGYHPWHWLLYRGLPFEAAFAWETLASFPLALTGMALFLGRHRLARDAALFGGLVYAASAFMLLRAMHVNAVAVMAHFPWLLWGLDRVWRETGRARLAGAVVLGLAWASQLLLGYPQYVWISLCGCGWYVAWLSLAGSSEPRRALAIIGLAGCAAALLSAVQWLPTADALVESSRQQVDAAWAAQGSLDPRNLVQVVAPYWSATRVVGENTHELGLYWGAAPLVLGVWLLTGRPPAQAERRLLGGVLVLGVLAFVLACGAHGPLGFWQAWLPVVNKFRFPCRYLVLVYWAVAVVAALAWSELSRRRAAEPPASNSSLLPWGGLLAAAALVALAGHHWLVDVEVSASLARWAGPVLLLVGCGLVRAMQAGCQWAPAAVACFTALDLGCYGLSYAAYPGARTPAEFFAAVRPPLVAPAGLGEARRVLAEPAGDAGLVSPVANRLTMVGWSRIDGYAGLMPARQLDYRRFATLRLAAVSHVPWKDAAGQPTWEPLRQPLPRARLLTRALVADHPARALDSGDWESTAVVAQPVALDPGPPGTVRWLVDCPHHQVLETETTGRQLLVVADRYHAGWRATVAGRPVEVCRVYGDFRGAVVPAGTHRVEWEFRPASLAWGRRISELGLLFSGLLLALGWVATRPVRSEEEHS